MSYSNPKWYGTGDTTSFSRSFENAFNTQFKNAYDYYDAKSKELEEYNNNLEIEAEKQRQELLKGKEVTPKVLAKVESAVQEFLKQGRQVTSDTDLFGAPDLVKKSKADIDKASTSFTGRIGVVNEFLESALAGKLIPKRDLDRGSATYLKYNKILNAIKKDPNSFDFKYTGDNEYDFSITYKDDDGSTKSVNADELKAMMELNDPEARKLIDKNFKDASVKMYGLTKTAFSERIAKGEYQKDPRTGSVYVPEEDVDLIVGEQVGKMKKETINDYFNNEIEYDDTKRLEILSENNPIGLELKDIADKGTNEQKEALSTLLDIPEGDVASREAAFNKLGITDKAKKQEYVEALNQYRKDIVADRFKEELKSQGLQTKYFAGKSISRGISRGRTSERTRTQKKVNIDEGSADAVSKLWVTMGDNKSLGFAKGYIDPGKVVTSSGTRKDVSNTRYDASANTFTVEWKSGKEYDKKTYDLNNPKEMRSLYKDFAFTKFNEGGWEKSTIESIEKQGYAPLNRDNMQEWVAWIEEKGTKQDVQNMKMFLVENILPSGSTSSVVKTTWSDFIKKHKEEIDDMYTEYRQSKTN